MLAKGCPWRITHRAEKKIELVIMLFLTRLCSNSRHIPFEHYRSVTIRPVGFPKQPSTGEISPLFDNGLVNDPSPSDGTDRAESDGLVSTLLDRVSHDALANDPYLLED